VPGAVAASNIFGVDTSRSGCACVPPYRSSRNQPSLRYLAITRCLVLLSGARCRCVKRLSTSICRHAYANARRRRECRCQAFVCRVQRYGVLLPCYTARWFELSVVIQSREACQNRTPSACVDTTAAVYALYVAAAMRSKNARRAVLPVSCLRCRCEPPAAAHHPPPACHPPQERKCGFYVGYAQAVVVRA